MNSVIKMQIMGFLIPLTYVPVKGIEEVAAGESAIGLEVISTEAIGMGPEVYEDPEYDSGLVAFLPYRSEITLHYYGLDGVQILSDLANQLRRPSVLEQNQRALFGIEKLGKVATAENIVTEDGPMPHAVFHFTIHYTERLFDDTGVIETINAAHDGGETTIHLTR